MDIIEELRKKDKEITAKIKNDIKTGVDGLYSWQDGIIDVERYIKSKYKILWILKEPVGGGNYNLARGYAEFTMNDMKKLGVARRVMKISHKLLSEKEMALEAFKSIAYINIKKIPGKSSTEGGSNDNEIQEAYNKYQYIIDEQITTYNPDIIICGNTLRFFSQKESILKRPIERKISFNNDPKSIWCYYPLKDKLYINITHPGNPKLQKETNEFWNEYVKNIINAVSDWEKNYKGKE